VTAENSAPKNSTSFNTTRSQRHTSSNKYNLCYFYRKHFDLKMCALYDIGIHSLNNKSNHNKMEKESERERERERKNENV
jgi:hypothetical protein